MQAFPLRAFLALATLAFAAPAFAQAECTGRPGPIRFWVNVEGVRSAQGLVAVTLYADEPRRFLARRGSLYVGRVSARPGTTRVCIHLPSTGTWAFAVYHDADSNRNLTRTGIGFPREGFGFSNNPRTFMSIPAFRSVRVSVPRNDMQTTIRLRYP